MGRTLRPQVALYLDPEKVEALAKLAESTGRTQQDLLREAVDDMLVRYIARHKTLKAPKRRK